MKISKKWILEKLNEYKEKTKREKVLTGQMKERTLSSNISVVKSWIKTLPSVVESKSVEDLLTRYKPKYHKDKVKNFLKYLFEELKGTTEQDVEEKVDSSSNIVVDFEDLVFEKIETETISINTLIGKPVIITLLTGKELKGEIIKIVKGKSYMLVLKQQIAISGGRFNPRLGIKNATKEKEIYKVIPLSSIEYISVPSELFRC